MNYKVLNIKDGRLEIDNSGLGEYYTCPLKYYFKQILRRIPVEEDEHATNFGSGCHIGLETFYLGGSLADIEKAIYQHFKDNPQRNPLDPRTPERAFELVKLNIETFKEDKITPLKLKDSEGIEHLAVEQSFRKYIGSYTLEVDIQGWDRVYQKGESIDLFWIGMIDLIYKDRFGLIAIMDHKTTGSFWNFFQRYQEAGQFKGYLWAVNGILSQMEGFEGIWVDKFTINGMMCSKSGKLEVDRHTFRSNEEKINLWEETTYRDIVGLVKMAESGIWSRFGFKNCGYQYGRKCSFFDVCSGSEGSYGVQLGGSSFKEYKWSPLKEEG